MIGAVSEVVERRFRAMGCRASILVHRDIDGDVDRHTVNQWVELAARRIAHLERCWSRFDETSDISAINRAEGRPVRIDPSTIDLVRFMVIGHHITRGVFHPFHPSAEGVDSSSIDGIGLDPISQIVKVPAGLRLDPGGVGKGLASDLVARQLCDLGALGALVEIGGDMRVVGKGPHHGFWSVGVEDPFGRIDGAGVVLVQDGGVSTSGLLTPHDESGPINVSVDPRTRAPIEVRPGRVISATVIAGTAFEAEVWSTELLVSGSTDLEPIRDRGHVARVVTERGEVRATDEWNRIFSPNEVALV